MVRVVGSLGWICLLGSLSLIMFALIWACISVVHVSVKGEGVLVPADLHAITLAAAKAGRLGSVVPLGVQVAAGQTVAVIESIDAISARAEAQRRLDGLESERKSTMAMFDRQMAAERHENVHNKQRLVDSIAASRREISRVEALVTQHEVLYRQGLIALNAVEALRSRLFDLRASLSAAQNELAAIDRNVDRVDVERVTALHSIDESIGILKSNLAELATTIQAAAHITSPFAGQVVARYANEGSLVEANSRLMTIHAGGKDIEAILFVPVEDGKKVKLNMAVQLTPSVTTVETGGSLRGMVTWVSPTSRAEAEIGEMIGQQDMAHRLVRKGPPIEVHVRLLRDSHSANGYAWTSARGGDITLSPGTVLNGSILIRKEHPITYILPAFRRWMGVS